MVSSHTTAASAEAHENHESKETKNHLCICLVGAVIAEPLIELESCRVPSDVNAADVLSWSLTKRSILADRIEAEYACDNNCGHIDALCQAEKAAA